MRETNTDKFQPSSEKEKKIVVEVGPGYLPYFVLGTRKPQANERYIGVDADPFSLAGDDLENKKIVKQLIQSHTGKEFHHDAHMIQGKGGNLPLKTSSVDEVVMTNTLSYILIMERSHKAVPFGVVMSDVNRVLKPGGFCRITEKLTPLAFYAHFHLPNDINGLNVEILNNIFSPFGFVIETFSKDERSISPYDNGDIDHIAPKEKNFRFHVVLKKIRDLKPKKV